MQVRLDARSKRLVERAAGFRRESVSRFVLGTVLAEAESIVGERDSIVLSERDWTIFYEALSSPPAPNVALREAARRYRKGGA